jgi:hypothetical protein
MNGAAGDTAVEVAQLVPFADLCRLFDECANRNRPMVKKRERLRLFIDNWRGVHQRLHEKNGTLTATVGVRQRACVRRTRTHAGAD